MPPDRFLERKFILLQKHGSVFIFLYTNEQMFSFFKNAFQSSVICWWGLKGHHHSSGVLRPGNWKTNSLALLILRLENKPKESGDASSLCSTDRPLGIDSVKCSEHSLDFSPKPVQSGHGSIWIFDRKCLCVGVELNVMPCQGKGGIKFSLISLLNSIKGGNLWVASELEKNRCLGRNGVLKIKIDGAKVKLPLSMGIILLGILKTSQMFFHASMTNYV